MDDGKVNAMSVEMLREIEGRLQEASAAGGPVVLRGRPGIFSAGFDMKTFARGPEASREMVLAGVRLIEGMLALPRPIVTVCTGHAYPMGAFLLLSADVRYGAEGAWNIGLNEVAIGLAVPQFAIELARHRLTPAGVARASTAAMFTPLEAARLGYLDYVLGAEQLDAAVRQETRRLARLDMQKYALTKARLNAPVLAAIAAARAEL
jgi:enoyl-CoA hydratase